MSQPYQPCEICIDEQCHEMLKTLEFYVLKLSDKQKCLILCETYNNLFCERDSN